MVPASTALGGGAEVESLEQRHVAGSDGQPERLLLRLVLDEEAACRGHLHVGHMCMCMCMLCMCMWLGHLAPCAVHGMLSCAWTGHGRASWTCRGRVAASLGDAEAACHASVHLDPRRPVGVRVVEEERAARLRVEQVLIQLLLGATQDVTAASAAAASRPCGRLSSCPGDTRVKVSSLTASA